jgi:hypothetical protein
MNHLRSKGLGPGMVNGKDGKWMIKAVVDVHA